MAVWTSDSFFEKNASPCPKLSCLGLLRSKMTQYILFLVLTILYHLQAVQAVPSNIMYKKTKVFANQTSPIFEVTATSLIECLAHCYLKFGETYCCYAAVFKETTPNCVCLSFSCLVPLPDPNAPNNSVLDVHSLCGNKQIYTERNHTSPNSRHNNTFKINVHGSKRVTGLSIPFLVGLILYSEILLKLISNI